MSKNYHLTYNSEKDGWDIKKEGASQISDHFESHSKALDRARELTVNAKSNLILHDQSGQITGSETAEDIEKGILSTPSALLKRAVDGVASVFRG